MEYCLSRIKVDGGVCVLGQVPSRAFRGKWLNCRLRYVDIYTAPHIRTKAETITIAIIIIVGRRGGIGLPNVIMYSGYDSNTVIQPSTLNIIHVHVQVESIRWMYGPAIRQRLWPGVDR